VSTTVEENAREAPAWSSRAGSSPQTIATVLEKRQSALSGISQWDLRSSHSEGAAFRVGSRVADGVPGAGREPSAAVLEKASNLFAASRATSLQRADNVVWETYNSRFRNAMRESGDRVELTRSSAASSSVLLETIGGRVSLERMHTVSA
jgi:hypothetical protein